MLRIALTGGIASGKTSVSDEFTKLGVSVIDADIVAREVVMPGSKSLEQLVSIFGNRILQDDKGLDRAVLRETIFKDQGKRKQVEAILHPAIRTRSNDLILACERANEPYCIHVIPLLLETKQSGNYDRIIVVDVPVSTQLDRLNTRDNSNDKRSMAIINSQASRDERLAIADDVILNLGTLAELQSTVLELHKQYIKLGTLLKASD